MFDNGLTTVQITKTANKMLGEIAEYFNRSKTGQLEWWIKNEHCRIFQDGETAHEKEADSIPPAEEQP